MYGQDRIVDIRRKRPARYVVYLEIPEKSGGGIRHFLINVKALEILKKHFGVLKRKDLLNKFFAEDAVPYHDLTFFFQRNHPGVSGVEVSTYNMVYPKYNPGVWKITNVRPERMHHFLFGPGEEDYYLVFLEGHPYKSTVGFPLTTTFLRKKTLELVMKYFKVESPGDLKGKEFRSNHGNNGEMALMTLALKTEYPELV